MKAHLSCKKCLTVFVSMVLLCQAAEKVNSATTTANYRVSVGADDGYAIIANKGIQDTKDCSLISSLQAEEGYSIFFTEDATYPSCDGWAWDQGQQTLDGNSLFIGTNNRDYFVPYPVSAMQFGMLGVFRGMEVISANFRIYTGDEMNDGRVYGIIHGGLPGWPYVFEDISLIEKTQASVDWDHIDAWQPNSWYYSPNLSNIVQELINKPDWKAGHPMTMVYSTREKSPHTRSFLSSENGYDLAPKLRIRFRACVIFGYVRTAEGGPIKFATIDGGDYLEKRTTDSDGSYQFFVPPGWSGTLTVSKDDIVFKPAQYTYTNLNTHMYEQNFIEYKPKISGFVFDKYGNGVEQVNVAANNGGATGLTDANGFYEILVPLDWSGIVTANKSRWKITPDGISYSNVVTDQNDQNYSAYQPTISGHAKDAQGVLLAGVTIEAQGIETSLTDANGYYQIDVPYQWSGQITASMPDFGFLPLYRSYYKLTIDTTNQDFMSFQPKISGHILKADGSGMEGVAVSANNGGGSCVTNSSGYYIITVPYNWSGTVSVNKVGYEFVPPNRTYSNVTGNWSNQNYTEFQPVISGYVKDSGGTGVEGVLVSADNNGGSDITEPNGYYEIALPYDWSGTVTPIKTGWHIIPLNRSYSNVMTNQTNQDYTAFQPKIYGHVTDSNGIGVEGILVTADNGGGSGVTDPNGYYEIIVPYGWSGSVTPSHLDREVTPASRSYSNVVSDQANQNYSVSCTVIDVKLDGNGDFVTIQAAIDAAITGDTVIVYQGRYYENINFRGKDIILRSTEPNDPNMVATTIIDGNNLGSVVAFAGIESSNCLLLGFAITGGDSRYGGGIYGNYSHHTKATVENCIISGNCTASYGYSAVVAYCDGTIQNCTISDNSGSGLERCGGTIKNCTISNNSEARNGGGLQDCDGIIQNCTITGNSATDHGGGLYDCDGNIKNCKISNNSAEYSGGGLIYCDGTIENCIISDNWTKMKNPVPYYRSDGGGLLACQGTIKNCMILSNWAKDDGGGLYNCDGSIENCTISGNFAWSNGDGLANCNGTIVNSIIWGNPNTQMYTCSTPSYSCIQDWSSGGIGNINADPEFIDAYHLSLTSPCIDAGDPNYACEPNTTDIDGDPRIAVKVDMGADEISSLSALILLSPDSLNFLSEGLTSGLQSQDILIKNYGAEILNWQSEISGDCNWLTASQMSGQLSMGEDCEIQITVDPSGTGYGLHSCQLQVIDPGAENSPQVVTVNLEVLGPELVISDSVFNFTMAGIESNTAPQVLTIQNAGYDILDWHIAMENGYDWLKASPLAGQAGHMETDEVILSIDYNNIDYGTFSCQLNVSDPNAQNSPQVVTVNLDVLGPVLTVNPAQFYFETSLAEPNTTGQILYIQNTGYDTLYWDVNIPVGCNWLNASEISGQSTGELDEVVLSIDHNNIERGFYQCEILISAPDAKNSPQVIPVDLRVLGMNGQRYVPTEYPTIQAAVDAAVDGDEVIIEPGRYTGPGNYNIFFRYKAITVRSIDPNNPAIVAATVIEPNTIASAFILHCYYWEQGDSIIDGLTIRLCIGRPAIYCYGGTPTIRNCIIEDNYNYDSQYFGVYGVECYDSNAVISNCVIRNNRGSGLRCSNSDLIVRNCIFTGNRGSYTGPGSSIMMSFGGGILHWGGNLSVINCTFSGNLADVGGGICSFGSYAYWNNMTISNCIFRENDANDGPQIALKLDYKDNPSTVSVSYSDVEGGDAAVYVDPCCTLNWGDGNLDIDPCFAEPGYWELNGTPEDANDDFWVDGDYHLKSQEGRWKPLIYTGLDSNNDGFINQFDFAAFANSWRKQGAAIPADFDHSGIVDFSDLRLLLNNYPRSYTPGQWVLDDVTSPCIDAGDPNSNWIPELWPHGSRINMGAYGGTPEASMSLSDAGNIADLNWDGSVGYADMIFFMGKWLCEGILLAEDFDRNGFVSLSDFAIFARNWEGSPGLASEPNPSNGATGVDLDADLSWAAGYGASSHDVYFGTSNPPPFICNQTSTTFDPGPMSHIKYYWRIDEVNTRGKSRGTTWFFRTSIPPPPPPPPPT